MATLEIEDLVKTYGKAAAVDHISFSVPDGKILALLGGSGCGKTTTLRMIAGFTKPTSGTIRIDGKDIGHVPTHKRNIGVFFQNYALFPHMTVFENIAFGLETRKLSKEVIRQKVMKMLALVKLERMETRFPRQLSGGQQQRVALARALVTEPSILLLDEPLSNLDAKLRVEMQEEIKRLQNQLKITTIIVTHDQEEAISMADEIVVMKKGCIHQVGLPKTVFDEPEDFFVADFMGFSNALEGTIQAKSDDFLSVQVGGQTLRVPAARGKDLTINDAVILTFRPESVSLEPSDGPDAPNVFDGRLCSQIYKGTITRLEVGDIFDTPLFLNVTDDFACKVGDRIRVSILADKLRLYKKVSS